MSFSAKCSQIGDGGTRRLFCARLRRKYALEGIHCETERDKASRRDCSHNPDAFTGKSIPSGSHRDLSSIGRLNRVRCDECVSGIIWRPGYVSLYADFLATQANGIRPRVVNLAIPGEASTGFFTAVSPPGLPPHDLLASVNLNYHGDGSLSQDVLLLNTLAAEAAAGHAITSVSFAIWSNDVTSFIASRPRTRADRGRDDRRL